jgi:hypothetical protein
LRLSNTYGTDLTEGELIEKDWPSFISEELLELLSLYLLLWGDIFCLFLGTRFAVSNYSSEYFG